MREALDLLLLAAQLDLQRREITAAGRLMGELLQFRAALVELGLTLIELL